MFPKPALAGKLRKASQVYDSESEIKSPKPPNPKRSKPNNPPQTPVLDDPIGLTNS